MAQTKALFCSRAYWRASARWLLVGCSLGLTLFMSTVRAQSVEAAGAAREQNLAQLALTRTEYGEAQRLSKAELESGSLGPEEFARALRVLAIASAHLGDTASASRAFTTLLAVQPAFRLDRGESDDVRSPYLEARGFWSAHATPLAAKVVRAAGGVEVELVDPAAIVVRVRLRARVQGSATFSDVVQKPGTRISFPVSGLSDDRALEYSVALLDEHGNRLLKMGGDSDPAQLAAIAAPKVAPPPPSKVVAVVAAPSQSSSAAPGRRGRRRLFLSMGSAVMALGLGAAAVGVRAHLEREDQAERWNKGTCSGTGTTRAELCADERARIRTLEATTTALYSAGGAALLTGVVLLLLAPERRDHQAEQAARRAAFGCSGTAGGLGVACARTF